ncbi:hypothetical protein [Actinoallomurus sp. CA-150999]|uniref:hypothetical protein n=1 Tax=Actinoallomurus sp. CA-150999 TaxID=3239887 RepID=UPI003D9302F2
MIGVPLAAMFVLFALHARHDDPGHPSVGMSIAAAMFLTVALWLPGPICLIIGLSRQRGLRRGAPLREKAWQVSAAARYCFRDHVVYLPDGAHAPAEFARSLFFDIAQRALDQPSAPPQLRR